MRLLRAGPILLLVSLLAVACAGDDDDDAGTDPTSDERIPAATSTGDAGEGSSGTPAASGSGLGDAGFPTVFAAAAEPEVTRIAEDDEANERQILFGLNGLTTEDSNTEASFLLSATEVPEDGSVECGGDEFDGSVSDVEGEGIQPGLVEITPSGFLDLTLENAVAVFEEGDERAVICLEYRGVYSGSSTDFEGLGGSFTIIFSDGRTTLTFDE